MNNKTCFFIGSRYATDSIKQQLAHAVEKHITEYGIKTFTVGNYGSFDRLVQCVLQEVKKYHPSIKLYLLAPYALDQRVEPPKAFNGTYYPDGLEFVPKRYAIAQANRYMIHNSDYLISCCHGIGNSRKLTEYAQKLEKKGLIKVTLI